jgi:hypothetical protein
MPSRYSDLTHDELVRLLEARDRRDATRFGLVWEANEIERDRAVNDDFVALDLVPQQVDPTTLRTDRRLPPSFTPLTREYLRG